MQTIHKLPKSITKDLRAFLEQSGYLITNEVGGVVIQERIDRLLKQLSDPNCPFRKGAYKLIAAYAVLGLMREDLEIDTTKQQ
jgi:hypothetical protein